MGAAHNGIGHAGLPIVEYDGAYGGGQTVALGVVVVDGYHLDAGGLIGLVVRGHGVYVAIHIGVDGQMEFYGVNNLTVGIVLEYLVNYFQSFFFGDERVDLFFVEKQNLTFFHGGTSKYFSRKHLCFLI